MSGNNFLSDNPELTLAKILPFLDPSDIRSIMLKFPVLAEDLQMNKSYCHRHDIHWSGTNELDDVCRIIEQDGKDASAFRQWYLEQSQVPDPCDFDGMESTQASRIWLEHDKEYSKYYRMLKLCWSCEEDLHHKIRMAEEGKMPCPECFEFVKWYDILCCSHCGEKNKCWNFFRMDHNDLRSCSECVDTFCDDCLSGPCITCNAYFCIECTNGESIVNCDACRNSTCVNCEFLRCNQSRGCV